MGAGTPAIAALGDRAMVVRLGDTIDEATSARVLACWRRLSAAQGPGIVDLVPAYTTLTIHYDWRRLPEPARTGPWQWLSRAVADAIGDAADDDGATTAGREIELPVHYGGEDGPDLEALARECGMDAAEVVRRHSASTCIVAFLGFRPGFPYLLGLDPALAAPRLATPRSHVPAGSVGIAGAQTGVYPAAGPGGWRIIGRTARPLFDPLADPPALLAPGDRLRFVPVAAHDLAHAGRQPTGETTSGPPADTFIDVLSPGIHTSVQDCGRPGWRHLGIAAGGAYDAIAATIANALVGNAPGAAVLEMTLRGPDLRFEAETVIALAGDGMAAFVDGQEIPFARPVALAAGAQLSFRATGFGARAWLAVAGGIAAPRWLGSASVEFGSGVFGRALRAGDRLGIAGGSCARLQVPAGRRWQAAPWWVDARAQIDTPMILRFVADADASGTTLHALAAQVWRASTAADRKGVRMEGRPLEISAGAGRGISTGVLHGTIQLPPDGHPILLGPDCQTTGGYPVAGHVIEADLPRLAQLKPGDLVWLQPVSIAEAHAARLAQAALLARLHVAISAKLGSTTT